MYAITVSQSCGEMSSLNAAGKTIVQMLKLHFWRIVFVVSFLLGPTWLCHGQISDTGLDEFGTFQRNHVQAINLYNLNNHIEIPIFSKTARTLTFNEKFVWDLSDSFISVPHVGGPEWVPSAYPVVTGGGVTYNSHIIAQNLTCTQQYRNQATEIFFDSIADQNGTLHRIVAGPTQFPALTVGPGCQTGSISFFTYDGWLLNLAYTNTCYPNGPYQCISATETDTAGNQRRQNAQVTDPNGNQILVDGSGTVTDSTGNKVLWASGGGNTLSYPIQSGTANVQFIGSTFTLPTTFGCIVYQPRGGNGIGLTTAVLLPDGSQYSFVYESATGSYPSTLVTGRLHSITVPAGATYTYSYSGGTNGVNCNDGKPVILTVSGSDGSVWTYKRTVSTAQPPNPTVTVVTDPACNDSVYTFDPYSGWQTQVQAYKGTAGTANCSATTKTLLKTVTTCYNGNFTNCTTPSVGVPTPPIPPPSRVDAYTILPNSTQPSLSEQIYNSNELLTQDNEFPFGVNTGGAPTTTPLKATMITYASVGSNILNRPSCRQVTAGWSPSSCGTVNGTTTSITKYSNYDAAGNVGTVQQWVSGSTYLSRSFSYTTGMVHVATDPDGAQTTTTYNACNSSYPDTITYNGFSRTLSWDCNGGVVTQIKDENNQLTQYQFNDPFWRIKLVTDPFLNTTSYNYTPTTEESILSFVSPTCSTCTVDNLTTYDSLGRPYLSQTLQAPGSATWDTVVTTYDGNSRIASVGMPCASQKSQPCASTSASNTTYDTLNRLVQVQDGGGGYSNYTYGGTTAFDVAITRGPAPTGENLKSRQLEYDALGRLTSVCEILATGGTSCNQSSTASGYGASYSYRTPSVGGSQMVVTQGVQSRTYVYDGAARLISESNPESGKTTYTYDSANTPACGAVNQSGSLLVVTDNANNYYCYQNDTLGRPLAVGNSNNSTSPCKRFSYDTSSGFVGQGPPSGYVENNIKDRIVEAETDDCTWPTSPAHMLSDEWYAYDANGRMTDMWEYTSKSKVYYHTSASYFANNAPNQLAGLPGYSTLTYNLDGEGRWNSAMLGSIPVVSGVTYDAASNPKTISIGSGTDEDQYSYDGLERMSQYQFFVGTKNNKGVPAWNPNGSLGSLAITDGFNSSNNQTCSFAYDDLSRLTTDNCGSVWSQTYSYDQYGNLTKAGSAAFACAGCYNPATNQYQTIGATYDLDGNLTYDGAANHYTWDVYGKMATVNGAKVTYDAFGRPVTNGSVEILYTPVGKVGVLLNAANFDNAYVPLPGGGAMTLGCCSSDNIWYLHRDWVGSSRFTSDVPASGNGGLTNDRSYSPFGDVYQPVGFNDALSFAGLNSDLFATSGTSSIIYDTPNRELANNASRWLSPDPSGLQAVDPSNPQSWNRYAYALGNPLSAVDPTGLYCVYVNDAGVGTESVDGSSSMDECGSTGGYWIQGDLGGGSWWKINSDSGIVSGLGYDASGNAEISNAGAMGSNVWGAWTQTFTSPAVVAIFQSGGSAANGNWAWNFTRNLFSWQQFGAGQIDAQNKGYYRCLGNKVIPFKGLIAAAAAKGAEELATTAAENYGGKLAGAYYHFTDGRFTAWGQSSKVLVPEAAETIGQVAKGVSIAGWALTDIEGAHAIYECSGALSGKD